MTQWRTDNFTAMDRRYRANFFNTLTGFKSASLVGTINDAGQTNLALFSSAVHIGANPPYIGLIFRPLTVPRHTYDNIKATGFYTLNHIGASFYEQAHQTSAKYEADVSEFEAVGLTPQYSDLHPAPYVAESAIQLGLEYAEEHPIAVNETVLLVGRVIEARLSDSYIADDGSVDIEAAGSVTISGLDSYHQTQRLKRLPYARPE